MLDRLLRPVQNEQGIVWCLVLVGARRPNRDRPDRTSLWVKEERMTKDEAEAILTEFEKAGYRHEPSLYKRLRCDLLSRIQCPEEYLPVGHKTDELLDEVAELTKRLNEAMGELLEHRSAK